MGRGVGGMLCVMSALVLGASNPARAQAPSAVAGNSTPGWNPYTNPALNPFLSPGAMMATMSGPPMDGRTALYYMLQAQRLNGGIGSGVPSGTRPGPAAGPAGRSPAEVPHTAAIPGGAAARYYQRAPLIGSANSAHLGRHDRYFHRNGH